MIALILGIVLGAVTVVFALQNVEIITVSFFSWHFDGSLSLILILTAGMGALVALLMVLPESIANHFRFRNLQKENAKLVEDLRKQKELTVFAKQNPPTEAELAHIDRGSIAHPQS